MPRWTQVLVALALFMAGIGGARAADAPVIRIGLVKFGTASWGIDAIRAHGFDNQAGISIATTDLANPAGGEVALQSGGVDAIFTDWLWVARQRKAGQNITFIPRSASLGEILVPAASPVRSPADLAGKRLGVAGGPLDKSWLLLRAYSQRALGFDLAEKAQVEFAAPPLLSQELASGRVDAVLTFWPFAARLSAKGFRTVLSMNQVMAGLGFDPPVPLMGYGVSEAWIAAHPGGVERFLAADDAAQRLLATDDAEWQRLRPLTKAEDDTTLTALRDRYRAGQIHTRAEGSPPRAPALFTVLAHTGGAELTGGATEITAGTFWHGGAP